MPVYGKVAAVVEEPVGTTLSADVVATATSLPVDDLSQLAWPEGTLQVGDEVIAYTVDGLPDQATDELSNDEDTTDLEAGTVTLGVALANDHPQDTPVTMYPDVVERTATVILPGQQEELHLRVPQHLVDRLPTGVRTEPDGDDATSTSETVELEFRDDDWVIVDLVAQKGTGFSRGQVERTTPLTVTASSPATAQIVCSVDIEIPTPQHRIVVSYAAHIGNPSGPAAGTSDCFLGFADNLGDFSTPILLGDYDHTGATVNPQLVIPMLPKLNAETAIVAGDLIDATARLFNDFGGFTPFMPYVLTPPTVGLHNFRLVAWTGSGGTGRVTDASLWVAVI